MPKPKPTPTDEPLSAKDAAKLAKDNSSTEFRNIMNAVKAEASQGLHSVAILRPRKDTADKLTNLGYWITFPDRPTRYVTLHWDARPEAERITGTLTKEPRA